MATYEFIEVESTSAFVMRATCDHASMGPTISKLFGALGAACVDAEMSGPPMVKYTAWHENDCELEAAFPVDSSAPAIEGVEKKDYPACTALTTTYTGPYDGLSDAWQEMWKHVEANGIKGDMPCWDVYVTDPSAEPDPTKWVTELYIPLLKI